MKKYKAKLGHWTVTQYWIMSACARHETNKFQQQDRNAEASSALIELLAASHVRSSHTQRKARLKRDEDDLCIYTHDMLIHTHLLAHLHTHTYTHSWGSTIVKNEACSSAKNIWLYCDVLVWYMLPLAWLENRKRAVYLLYTL